MPWGFILKPWVYSVVRWTIFGITERSSTINQHTSQSMLESNHWAVKPVQLKGTADLKSSCASGRVIQLPAVLPRQLPHGTASQVCLQGSLQTFSGTLIHHKPRVVLNSKLPLKPNWNWVSQEYKLKDNFCTEDKMVYAVFLVFLSDILNI